MHGTGGKRSAIQRQVSPPAEQNTDMISGIESSYIALYIGMK